MVSDRSYGRYRGIILALGWLILTAQHPNPKTETEQAATQQAIADSLGNISATYNEEAERAHSAKQDTEDCGPTQYKSNADLCAQWKAADAARDGAWWAEVGTYVGGISGVLVLIALGLAYHANSIARDTAKRQLRAYLSPRIKGVPPANKVGPAFSVGISLKNVGQTPALNARFQSQIFIAPYPLPDGHFLPSEWKDVGSGIVYPSDESDFPAKHGIIPPAIAAKVTQWGGDTRIYAAARIYYEDVFGMKWAEQICGSINFMPDGQARSEHGTPYDYSGLAKDLS